jgi:hypothetical protein
MSNIDRLPHDTSDDKAEVAEWDRMPIGALRRAAQELGDP